MKHSFRKNYIFPIHMIDPVPPITNSINPTGTIIDIADVTLAPTAFSWAQGVSGDFATASNWTPAGVPGPANDVTIIAKGTYTVTSSADEIVDTLTIANKNVTLLVTGPSNYSTFTMTNGGTNDGTIELGNLAVLNEGTPSGTASFTNAGSIDLSTTSSVFFVEGNVSLQGNGDLNLDGGDITSDSPASGVGFPATLSNASRIIGIGDIGDGVTNLTLVNQSTGIIDATGADALTIVAVPGGTVDVNSGILESTNPNDLVSVGGLILSQDLTIDNQNGIIEAHGANTQVDLDNATIVGGTLETSGSNAVIQTVSGHTSTFDGTQSGNPVDVAGHVLVVDNSDLALMGTINNTGVITVTSSNPINGGDVTRLIINGDVTLDGDGHVTLGDNANNFIQANPVLPASQSDLANVDNVISGGGGIFVSLSNQGIVDANDSTPLILAGVTGGGPDTNAGLTEATQGGTLLIQSVIDNYLGSTNGTVEAANGSTVGLENATIIDGLVTIKNGGIIEGEQGSNLISGAAVTNAGMLGAEGANLTVIGNVTNTSGTLDANNATLVVDGTVSGGKATIEGTGESEFRGPSSASVTIGVSTDAILKLDNPSTFTGTVSGLGTGAYIDLTNINFADDPTLSYSSKSHVLTVTDHVAGVTDTVTLKGTVGSFSDQSDGSGGTLITDPPSTNTVAVSHDQDSFVFAPHLGENGVSNANVHNDVLDLAHLEFAELAALMSQDNHDGALDLTAHDANDHLAAATAQHFHHFLV